MFSNILRNWSESLRHWVVRLPIFRKRLRRELPRQPFPEHWRSILRKNMGVFALLAPAEQRHLEQDVQTLVTLKNWEGCAGLEMTDEIKVTIAGQASLLLLGLEHDYFSRVKSILVYPSGFMVKRMRQETGILVEGEEALLGEAHYRGPVVLAWDEVLAGGQDATDGRNLVLHEFAHQLDALDGFFNGTPAIDDSTLLKRWKSVMTREFERLIRASERGRATLLAQYGATNEAEFFAVATEAFFELGDLMQRKHPDLYDLLRDYYHQDPAGRGRSMTRAN